MAAEGTGAITAEFRRWSGGITFAGLTSDDTITVGGEMGTIDLGSPASAATIEVRGTYKAITNVGSASVNTDGAIKAVDVASILEDTADMQPKLGTPAGADMSADIADLPTVSEFNTRTPSAAQLAYIVANAATGMEIVFDTGGGTTTAVFDTIDGGAPNATNDTYNGRLIVFTSGTLKGCVTDITDYTGGDTTAVITAIPFTPEAGHSARLI